MKTLFLFLIINTGYCGYLTKGCNFKNEMIKDIYLNDKDIKCEQIDPFIGVIKKINSIMDNKYKPLILSVHSKGFNGYCRGNILDFVINLEENNFKHTQADSFTFFAHEYGHHIFSEKLSVDFKPFRDQFTNYLFKEGNRLKIKVMNAEVALTLATDKNKKQLAHQFEAIDEELDEFMFSDVPFKTFEYLSNIILPYHELFADVIAIMYSNNPKGMYKALYNPELTGEELIRVNSRDFSIKYKLKGLSREVKVSELEYNKLSEKDKQIQNELYSRLTPHSILSESRRYIWEYHIKGKTFKENQLFIQELYKTLRDLIKERWEVKKRKSQLELNRELIFLLKKIET